MADINDAIAKQMLGPTSTPASNDKFEKLMEEYAKYSKDIKEAVESHRDLFKKFADKDEKLISEIIDALQEQNKKGKRGRGTGSVDMNTKMLESLKKREANAKKFNAELSKGPLGSGAKGLNASIARMEKLVADMGKRAGNMPGLPPPRPPGGGGKGAAGDGAEYGREFGRSLGEAVHNTLAAVITGFMGGAHVMQLLTHGMISDEYEYAQGMHQIAYQTRAITNEAAGMQMQFRQTSDVVKTTGYDLTTFQTQLLRGTRRGLKDAQAITKTGLNLGKIMGLNEQEASQIADKFGDWNQHLGLSNNQLADISRGIQDISRITGVTGENLAEVVKNSDKFLDRMRDAGTLTANAAKNIMTLQAEAKKLGVADSISDLEAGMANNADLFLKSSKETQAVLFMAARASGKLQELQQGTLFETKSNMKAMAQGYEEIFKKFSGGRGFAQIGELDAVQKSRLNISLQASLGKGLDTMKREFESLSKSGETFADRMKAMDKELGAHATAEEKLTIERKKQELLMAKSFEFSSMLSEAANNATTFEGVLTNMKNKMSPAAWQETKMELADVAGTFSQELKNKVLKGDSKAMAEAMAVSAGEALKKAGGKDFTGQIKKAIYNKDFTKLRQVQTEMNKEQQRIGLETITKLDPIEEAAQQMKLMNETLRSYTGPALIAAVNTAGSTSFMAAYMAAGAAHAFFGIESLKDSYDALATLPGMFSGKAGKAAAVDPMMAALSKAALPTAATTAAGGAIAAEGTAAGGATAATAAGVSGPPGWAIAAVLAGILATIGGVLGNLWAGAEAANYFNVAQEDLTMAQYYAAKGAGTLTGALNFLTFGIFNKWLGTTGILTKKLAQLNEQFPILSVVAAALDVVVGYLWGNMKMLWNIIAGIVEGIYLVVEPVGAVLSAVFDVLKALFSPLTAFDEKLSETGSLFKIVSDIMSGAGMIIRWILRGLGALIGFLVKVNFAPLVFALKTISELITIVFRPLGQLLNGIMTFGMGIMKVVQGLYTMDVNTIGTGLKMMFMGVFKGIVLTFLSALKSLFVDLPIWILNKLKDVFIDLPRWLGRMFIGALKGIFVELPKMLWNGLMEGLTSLSADEWFGPIFEPFLEILTPLNDALKEIWSACGELFDAFGELFAPIADLLGFSGDWKSTIHAVSEAIGGMIRFALGPLKIVIEFIAPYIKSLAKGIKWLAGAAKTAAGWINKLIHGIIHPFEFLYDTLVGHSIVPDLINGIIDWFSKLPSNIMKSLLGLPWAIAKSSIAAFANLATWIYDGFVNALIPVWEWIKSWAPSTKTAKKIALDVAANPITNPAGYLARKTYNWMNPETQEAAANGLISKTQPVGQMAIPGVRLETNPNPQPLPLTDVHNFIQRDKTSAEGDSKKSSLSELSEMVSINENQLTYMMMLHGDMEKLIDLMTPGNQLSGHSGERGRPNTHSKTKPINSPNFHTWQFGKYQQNASKQVITDGR